MPVARVLVMNLHPFLLASLFPLVACSVRADPDPTPPPEGSSKYELADMQASFSAQSDGSKITVYAALLKGSAFLDLGDGDALNATVGGATKALVRTADGNAVHYTADFDQPSGAVPATIAFTRAGGRKGATSQVLLPAPFSLVAPPSAVSRAGQLVVTTNGLGTSSAKIELRGVCIDSGLYTGFGSADASGTVKLSLGSVRLADASAPSCPIEVTIEAYTQGRVDPAFEQTFPSATDFEGVQRRVFQSQMNP
jgi:hypothetical protein